MEVEVEMSTLININISTGVYVRYIFSLSRPCSSEDWMVLDGIVFGYGYGVCILSGEMYFY